MIEDRIRAELDRITDPCSVAAGAPAGLVEMGLVRNLTVTPAPDGAEVRLTIAVTEPGCLMGAAFAAQARDRLSALAEIGAVLVDIDHDADWLPSDLTPAYRLRLAEVRAANRQSR